MSGQSVSASATEPAATTDLSGLVVKGRLPIAPAETPQSALDPSVISRCDPYVTYTASTRYVLNAPADVVAADTAGYDAAQLAIANANATSGELTGLKMGCQNVDDALTGASKTVNASGSHGSGSVSWWGVSLYLDNWATNRIIAMIMGGAALSSAAAALTSWTGVGGLSGGAIAALFGLGAGALKICNWNDRGVGIHLERLTTIPLSWCWAR